MVVVAATAEVDATEVNAEKPQETQHASEATAREGGCVCKQPREGRMTGFCCGIAAGAVLVAVVVTVGSYVAIELMDGRSDAPF